MVRLDWNIDADTGKHQRVHLEDPKERKQRLRGVFRLLLVIVIMLSLAILAVFLISERLRQVDTRLEGLLQDTVTAEIKALRIGNEADFMAIQWDANGEEETTLTAWQNEQKAIFNIYQTLKSEASFQLTGNITDVTLDRQRGRIFVEEIIDGIAYERVWFYWQFAEGWQHVPPDYEFWGDADNIITEHFELRYKTVDTDFARAVQHSLTTWLNDACTFLPCETMPPLTIDIVPQSLKNITWAQNDAAWQMIIPSPYADPDDDDIPYTDKARTRVDIPFETTLQLKVATQLATRMVDHTLNNIQPQEFTDADYLRQSAISWLVGRFVQVDTGAYLINSLVENYGINSIRLLLNALEPASDMGKLREVIGVADLSQATLDWRDFLTWRLQTEDELIIRRDEVNWLRLIDTRDENLRVAAYNRFNNALPEKKTVASTLAGLTPDGTPYLDATVQVGEAGIFRLENVRFNLVNNIWLRAG